MGLRKELKALYDEWDRLNKEVLESPEFAAACEAVEKMLEDLAGRIKNTLLATLAGPTTLHKDRLSPPRDLVVEIRSVDEYPTEPR